MTNELTVTEASAVMALRGLMDAKTQLARVMRSQQIAPATLDWMLERGLVVVRMPNASPRQFFTKDVPCAYLTPAGKKWFHSTAGAGVALLVLARAARVA
jgi:hypothetical protein